jgi:hypothetical protein
MSQIQDANELVGVARKVGTTRLLIIAIIGLVGFIFFQEYRHNDRYTQTEADDDWVTHLTDHMPTSSAHSNEVESILIREKQPIETRFDDINNHFNNIEVRLKKLDKLEKIAENLATITANQKIIMKKMNLTGGDG